MKKSFGIIGNPIKHSLSPLMHNYWFKKYNIDANYSIIEIEEKDLPNIYKKIKDKDLTGINVTLPYKQKIIGHIDKIVNDAKATGSVNTLLLNDHASVIGENTDVFGLQAAYLKELDNGLHKKALVIGAGGVSPSVILSLQKCGIKHISITNRTQERCLFLKKKFNYLDILNWHNLQSEIENYDIIVNATSLGLKGGQDFDFNFSKCKNNAIYIDTIYNPLKTKTFKFLEEKGIKVFNGLDMFIYQGQKSFYLWNKINPEIDNGLIDLLLSRLQR
jgi:shikimate dehydrogenase